MHTHTIAHAHTHTHARAHTHTHTYAPRADACAHLPARARLHTARQPAVTMLSPFGFGGAAGLLLSAALAALPGGDLPADAWPALPRPAPRTGGRQQKQPRPDTSTSPTRGDAPIADPSAIRPRGGREGKRSKHKLSTLSTTWHAPDGSPISTDGLAICWGKDDCGVREAFDAGKDIEVRAPSQVVYVRSAPMLLTDYLTNTSKHFVYAERDSSTGLTHRVLLTATSVERFASAGAIAAS